MRDKVNILGTEYSISIVKEKTDKYLKGKHGYYDICSKQIILSKESYEEYANSKKKTDIIFFNQIMRHEIIHAFLYESGLDDHRSDEVLVDCLSIQIPKMIKAMNELEIL